MSRDVGKYPAYSVRDDSAELGTISLIDESGNTLFIRDRTCLGIHEDAYLMTAAPKLANALELIWAALKDEAELHGWEENEHFNALQTLAEGALAAARGEKS